MRRTVYLWKRIICQNFRFKYQNYHLSLIKAYISSFLRLMTSQTFDYQKIQQFTLLIITFKQKKLQSRAKFQIVVNSFALPNPTFLKNWLIFDRYIAQKRNFFNFWKGTHMTFLIITSKRIKLKSRVKSQIVGYSFAVPNLM